MDETKDGQSREVRDWFDSVRDVLRNRLQPKYLSNYVFSFYRIVNRSCLRHAQVRVDRKE